jgi:2-haloalkanoic acid dehalogenase type II
VRAVIFDYYFTLAEPPATDFVAVARTLGSAASVDDIANARQAFLHSRPTVAPSFDGASPEFRTYRAEWIDAGDGIFTSLGLSGGGAAYARQREESHAQAVPYADTLAALRSLRSAGLRVGVLSDADRGYLHASIARLGFAFDAVVCSEDVGCYKPHKSCFDMACTELGVESPQAVFVGDSPVADVEGSRRAGLRPVWINRRQLVWPPDLARPDVAVENLGELCALISGEHT